MENLDKLNDIAKVEHRKISAQDVDNEINNKLNSLRDELMKEIDKLRSEFISQTHH